MYASDAVMEEGVVGARVVVLGALPGPIQEVPLAELYSLYVALRFVLPNFSGLFIFYTNCMWVISSFKRGEQHCTASDCWGAFLWVRIFELVRSLLGEADGASKLVLTKIKAHTSLASCGMVPEQIYRRGGNHISDCAAKLGAKRHPMDERLLDERRAKSCLIRAFAVFYGQPAEWRWQTFGSRAFFDGQGTDDNGSSGDVGSDATTVCMPVASSHRIVLTEGLRWRCLRCFQTVESVDGLQDVACCDNTGATSSHRLLMSGSIVFLWAVRPQLRTSLSEAEVTLRCT